MAKQNNTNLYEHGKIPPQAIELEEVVIGAILLEPHSLNDVRDIISDKSFYKEANIIIYKAILELDKQNKQIDILTVTNHLKTTNELELVGGPFYIVQLTDRIASSANIQEHSAIIQEKFLKREIIRICTEKIKQAFDDSFEVFDILGDLSKQNNELITTNISGVFHISECTKEIFTIINKNISGEIKGMLTGFRDYDNFALGEQNGDVRYIAGETSQGKTTLAICEALNQALMGYRIAFFSYEMTKAQLTARLIGIVSDISSKSILMDKLTPEQVNDINTKISELIESNFYIIEVENREYFWLEQKIKTLKAKYNIQKVFIDYIQLIGRKDIKRRNEQVAAIANDLKFLAKHKNINIPFVVCSQLKRDENNAKPELWRLKESGDIENSADVVIGLWRPAFYGKEDIKIDLGNGISNVKTKGIGIMHILKGRNIGISNFRVNWNPNIPMYSDYSDNETINSDFNEKEPIF